MRRFAAAAYLLAGLAMAFICWQSLMMAVWGARTHWLQYAGLFSALILSGGAVTLLVTGERGQKACALGVAGLVLLMVPASVAVVPADGIRVNPLAYVILAAFVALTAAVMFYPERLRWARTIVLGLVLAMIGVIGVTAGRRWQDGEFNRPVIVGFQAKRSAAAIELPADIGAMLPADVRSEIARTGVGGRFRWSGMIGPRSREARLVVIATGPVPAARSLPYPKHGLIVYVWNGERWSTIPEGAACYAAHATLETDGMITQQSAASGQRSFGLFRWR